MKMRLSLEFIAAFIVAVFLILAVVAETRAGITSHIEQPVPRVYTGFVDFIGVGNATCRACPPGWTASSTGTGFYIVTHNLNLTGVPQWKISCSLSAFQFANVIVHPYSMSANFFSSLVYNPSTAAFADTDFHFICILNNNP